MLDSTGQRLCHFGLLCDPFQVVLQLGHHFAKFPKLFPQFLPQLHLISTDQILRVKFIQRGILLNQATILRLKICGICICIRLKVASLSCQLRHKLLVLLHQALIVAA